MALTSLLCHTFRVSSVIGEGVRHMDLENARKSSRRWRGHSRVALGALAVGSHRIWRRRDWSAGYGCSALRRGACVRLPSTTSSSVACTFTPLLSIASSRMHRDGGRVRRQGVSGLSFYKAHRDRSTSRCRQPRHRCIRLPEAQPSRDFANRHRLAHLGKSIRSWSRRSRRCCRTPLFALWSTTAAQTTAALQTDPPAASHGGPPRRF